MPRHAVAAACTVLDRPGLSKAPTAETVDPFQGLILAFGRANEEVDTEALDVGGGGAVAAPGEAADLVIGLTPRLTISKQASPS